MLLFLPLQVGWRSPRPKRLRWPALANPVEAAGRSRRAAAAGPGAAGVEACPPTSPTGPWASRVAAAAAEGVGRQTTTSTTGITGIGIGNTNTTNTIVINLGSIGSGSTAGAAVPGSTCMRPATTRRRRQAVGVERPPWPARRTIARARGPASGMALSSVSRLGCNEKSTFGLSTGASTLSQRRSYDRFVRFHEFFFDLF